MDVTSSRSCETLTGLFRPACSSSADLNATRKLFLDFAEMFGRQERSAWWESGGVRRINELMGSRVSSRARKISNTKAKFRLAR